MLSQHFGASIRLNFTGTSLRMAVAIKRLVDGAIAADKYPLINYRVDGGAWTTTQLTSTTTGVAVASGMAAGTHSAEVMIRAVFTYADRYNTPVSAVEVAGFDVDDGATVTAASPLAKRALFYGDSITEGVRILGADGVSGADDLLTYHDATLSWAYLLAGRLGAEYGPCAFAGSGWVSTFTFANVPVLPTSYSNYYSGQSRLTGGLLTPAPDYLICNVGANGGVSSSATVQTWVGNARTAAGADAWIIMIVPFGQTGATNFKAGVNAYLAANPSDAKTLLVDLGAIEGIGGALGSATAYTSDNLHLNTAGNELVAGLVFDAMVEAGAAEAADEVSVWGSVAFSFGGFRMHPGSPR